MLTCGLPSTYRRGCRCDECRNAETRTRRPAGDRPLTRCPICDGLFVAGRGYTLHLTLGAC